MRFEPGQEHGDLSGVIAALDRVAPPLEAPDGLAERVSEALAREAAAANGAPAPAFAPPAPRVERRMPWGRRAGLALAGAAAVAIAVFAGTRIGERGGPAGPLELQGTLVSPAGAAEGELSVARLGSGREISIETDSLPILPTGEYYELWFVGPGDSPENPNRISAGTFHPDESGLTDVELHAAVDPAKLPRIEVTAEPGDGDPAPSGEVVLRLADSR